MFRTLIVEDELTSRIILMTILLRVGPCDIAVNGQEAVSLFSSNLKNGKAYDLVCLDISMPGMDGHEVLRKIRELEHTQVRDSDRRAKVVVTTGSADPTDSSVAFREGCDAYVRKPIGRTALMSQLFDLGLHG